MKLRNILSILALCCAFALSAQNSLPAPGSPAGGGPGWGGGNSLPAPGNSGPSWGGGWGPWGPAYSPTWGIGMSPYYGPNWQNTGTATVMACGYDAQGVWRVMPLKVAYYYNGLQYQVTVLSAWDPWTDAWDYNVDVPAVNTSYYLRGNDYDFYAVLSTGTYYFNL